MRGTRGMLIGSAALLFAAVQPLAAQTTNGVPPRDTATKPAPKIDPKQVTDFIGSLIAPKPKPTPTPTPRPTPAPAPTPAPTQTTTPKPDPTATPRPTPKPVITPAPKPAPMATPRPVPIPRPVPAVAAPPVAQLPVAAAPVPTLDPAPPPASADVLANRQTPPAPWPWVLIAVVMTAVAAAGYGLKRWLSPKLALDCRIETATPRLVSAAHPLLSAPEVQLLVEIELGTPSTPRGLTILS